MRQRKYITSKALLSLEEDESIVVGTYVITRLDHDKWHVERGHETEQIALYSTSSGTDYWVIARYDYHRFQWISSDIYDDYVPSSRYLYTYSGTLSGLISHGIKKYNRPGDAIRAAFANN